LGGRNYLRNVLTGLALVPNPHIEPILFTGDRSGAVPAGWPPIPVIRAPMLVPRTLRWALSRIAKKVLDEERPLHRLLSRHGIDVLSHESTLTSNGSIPAIGWIPDFQHVHMPEFFSAQDRRARDQTFMRICTRSAKVIVSSEAALKDLRAFAPQFSAKAEVLRFVASLSDPAPEPQLRQLQLRYGFEGSYFLLPNQFWMHKNHRVVISALKQLKQQNRPVTVLATGATEDSRQPGYFRSLLAYAEESGVIDLFRVLGVVPFGDLTSLMLNAVAVINPSKFEGWSTSVEEAKSLGKRILLSDIPVHREQAPEGGTYFHPDDVEGLADCLWTAQVEFDPAVDLANQARARVLVSSRQLEFGLCYQRIVMSAVKSFPFG
jgi:glycosyltransferase involved in cell wall biosynthesis